MTAEVRFKLTTSYTKDHMYIFRANNVEARIVTRDTVVVAALLQRLSK